MNGFGDRTKIWHDNSTPSGTSDRNAAWKDFGSSMSALSFGFLATAILVSMFLIMAIFEHLLRSRASSPPPQSNAHGELDQMHSEKIKKSQNVSSPCLTFFFLSPVNKINSDLYVVTGGTFGFGRVLGLDARAALSNLHCSTSSSPLPKRRHRLAFS
ncbi:unnamed protein product [Musa acuminata subsp. burmannicoides]